MLTYILRIHNGMDTALNGLNLYSICEKLEAGQQDVISLDPDETVDINCDDTKPEGFLKRFKAAVEAVGGVAFTVSCRVYESAVPPPPLEEEE